MTYGSSDFEWKFSQVFGDQNPGEDVQDMDVVSAINFSKSGDHLAVGDRGGRVVIFERRTDKDVNDSHSRKELEELDFGVKPHPLFQYKTEFQSHEPEFDYLKSVEIEEKINEVKWCTTLNQSQFILSTNDKTIKLWKVKERKLKTVKTRGLNPLVSSKNVLYNDGQNKSSFTNGYSDLVEKMYSTKLLPHISHNRVTNIGDDAPATARCRKVYAHAHDFNINSISNNSDGETFASADDLRINLWNLEVSNQCFNIIDMKPSNMDDLTEVITSSEFHPLQCNTLAYSSSRGFIRLVDMRQSALCDHGARILRGGDSHGNKTFFTEIIASISDMKFAVDGRHILSRDYMTLKLWDTHMETSPVATYKIHEHLRPKLCDLYNNDAIFDKFDCCLSGNGLQYATGSYSNLVRTFSYGGGSEEGTILEASKIPNRKARLQATSRARRSSLSNITFGLYKNVNENSKSRSTELSCNLSSKLLHLAWHPSTNVIACAVGNSIFMYYA